MATIIAFSNQKGGVGKTTTAVNVGGYLASFGQRVLLIDTDPQANATTGLGFHPEHGTLNLYHCIADGADPKKAAVPTRVPNYFLLPASMDLAGAAVELVNVPQREFKLSEIVEKVAPEYDIVLIDCPPSLGVLTINGLVAADKVIVPVQCEYFALEGLSQLLRTIDLVRAHISPRVSIMGAVLTLFDKRNRLSREVEREVRKSFPAHVFQTMIPRSVYCAEAPSFGKTIMQYRGSSSGARAYKSFAQEILDLVQSAKDTVQNDSAQSQNHADEVSIPKL